MALVDIIREVAGRPDRNESDTDANGRTHLRGASLHVDEDRGDRSGKHSQLRRRDYLTVIEGSVEDTADGENASGIDRSAPRGVFGEDMK